MLLVWVAIVVSAVMVAGAMLGDSLTVSDDFTNNPESKQAATLLEQYRGTAESNVEYVVILGTATADDPAFQAHVAEVQAEVASLDVVEFAGSYLTGDGPVSASGHAVLVPYGLVGDDHDALTANAVVVSEAVAGMQADGFTTVVGGALTLENDIIRVAEESLVTGELIGLGVALVVLVFVFGAVVAGLIPLLLAIMAISIAMGLAALVGQVFELSFFIANIITMIGLAVGIDYSLFIISRYREEREAGFEKTEAIGRAGATAGKAVMFSGFTVILALAGMFLLPNTTMRGIGMGAILVVSISVLASLTLLPAVLALLGDRIERLRVRGRGRHSKGRFWDRITGVVTRRPVVSLVLAGGVLVMAAMPVFQMHQGFSGVSDLPDEVESKQAFLVLEEEFSGGLGSPVEVVIDGEITDSVAASIDELVEAMAADGSFGPVTIEVSATRDLAVVSALLDGDMLTDASLDAIRRVRGEVVPQVFAAEAVDVLVGGDTAENLDYLGQVSDYTPWVFLFVLGSSFFLLMIAFRSIVIPAKAILLNLLSVGAAYGLLVLFFQEGTGFGFIKDLADWLGFVQTESIQAGMPLFMFSILFGLSMDYHVFMLSRIRERFDETGDNDESVAYGLRTTGALITGAAAIMVAVFSGFATGALPGLQQMGFGLAVAVALDATIVRTILVPASMKLLGARNWWFPSWLGWLPEIHIEGTLAPEPAIGA
jgi:RND superfamily putative drug exporter